MRLIKTEKLNNCGGLSPSHDTLYSVTEAINCIRSFAVQKAAAAITAMTRLGDYSYPAATEVALGREYLASKAGLSLRSAERALATLQRVGWITQVSRGARRASVSRYFVAPAAEWNSKHFGLHDDRLDPNFQVVDYRTRERSKERAIPRPAREKKQRAKKDLKPATSEELKPAKFEILKPANLAGNVLPKELKNSSLTMELVLDCPPKPDELTFFKESENEKKQEPEQNSQYLGLPEEEIQTDSVGCDFDFFKSEEFQERNESKKEENTQAHHKTRTLKQFSEVSAQAAAPAPRGKQDQDSQVIQTTFGTQAEAKPESFSASRSDGQTAQTVSAARTASGTSAGSGTSSGHGTHDADTQRHVRLLRRAGRALLHHAVTACEISRADAQAMHNELRKYLTSEKSHDKRNMALALVVNILRSNRAQKEKVRLGKNVRLIENLPGLFRSGLTNPKGRVAESNYSEQKKIICQFLNHRRERYWANPPTEVVMLISSPFGAGMLPDDTAIKSGTADYCAFWTQEFWKLHRFLTSHEHIDAANTDDLARSHGDTHRVTHLRNLCGHREILPTDLTKPDHKRLAGAIACYYASSYFEQDRLMANFKTRCMAEAKPFTVKYFGDISAPAFTKEYELTDLPDLFDVMTTEEIEHAWAELVPNLTPECQSLTALELSQIKSPAGVQIRALVAVHHAEKKKMKLGSDLTTQCMHISAMRMLESFGLYEQAPNIGLTLEQMKTLNGCDPEEFLQSVDHDGLSALIHPLLDQAGLNVDTRALIGQKVLMGGPGLQLQWFAKSVLSGFPVNIAKAARGLDFSWLGGVFGFILSNKEVKSIPDLKTQPIRLVQDSTEIEHHQQNALGQDMQQERALDGNQGQPAERQQHAHTETTGMGKRQQGNFFPQEFDDPDAPRKDRQAFKSPADVLRSIMTQVNFNINQPTDGGQT